VDDSNALDQNEFEALMRSLREEQVLVKFADVGEAEFDEMCERSFVKFDEDSSGELDLPEIIRYGLGAFPNQAAPAVCRLSVRSYGRYYIHHIRTVLPLTRL
jgi:hypothetical protein